MSSRGRPRRTLDWIEGADGRVEVLRPKFGTGRLGRWISSRLSSPYLKIRLDEVGSFVWKRCDGEHSVEQIARELEPYGGATGDEVEARLDRFLEHMVRRGMIAM